MFKKALFLACLTLLPTLLFGYCYYVPCDPVVQMGQQQSQQQIEQSYEELFRELDELKNRYQKQLELLKEQNKLLASQKTLYRHSTSMARQVLFEMQKFIKLQSNANATKAAETLNAQ